MEILDFHLEQQIPIMHYQLGDKLARDVDKVLAFYKHLLSGLDLAIGAVREVRKPKEIIWEVQAFINTF